MFESEYIFGLEEETGTGPLDQEEVSFRDHEGFGGKIEVIITSGELKFKCRAFGLLSIGLWFFLRG